MHFNLILYHKEMFLTCFKLNYKNWEQFLANILKYCHFLLETFLKGRLGEIQRHSTLDLSRGGPTSQDFLNLSEELQQQGPSFTGKEL